MSLSIPYTFIGGPGNKAKASEVNANFLAVSSKFSEGSGGISDGDVATSAGIRGSKLSSVPGNRIPTDRIEDDAVDKDKLRDDATAGAPSAAVNTAAHIRDGIITPAKLVASSVPVDRLKITISSHTPAGSILVESTRAILPTQFTPNIPNVDTAIILAVWVQTANDTQEPKWSIVPVSNPTNLNNRVILVNPSDATTIVFGGEVIKVAWIGLT